MNLPGLLEELIKAQAKRAFQAPRSRGVSSKLLLHFMFRILPFGSLVSFKSWPIFSPINSTSEKLTFSFFSASIYAIKYFRCFQKTI
jgi:hypothetical protein